MVAKRPFSWRFLTPEDAAAAAAAAADVGIADGGNPKMLCEFPPPREGTAAVALARLDGRLLGRDGILDGVGKGLGLATDPGREGALLPAPVKLCLVLGLFSSCSETFLRLLAWSSLSATAS